MKIEIELDQEQLHILIAWLQVMFDHHDLDEYIEAAARRWTPKSTAKEDDGGLEYQVLKIAPVYRQIAKHWPAGEERPNYGIWYADDLFDFVAALRLARVGSAKGGDRL